MTEMNDPASLVGQNVRANDACTFSALRRAAQSLTTRFDAYLAPSGLRATMYRLLIHLEDGPSPTISTLARRIGLDRSTLGRNLRVLQRGGFVSLSEASDERARIVSLTENGRRALAIARPLWNEANREVREILGGAEHRLHELLQRLSAPER